MSFRPEILNTDGKWYPNGLRFATEAEAAASANHTFSNWTGAIGHRAAPSDDPVNYAWVDGRLVAPIESTPHA